MRPHGPLFWLPALAGTASHFFLTVKRYSLAFATGPYFAVRRPITSSIGSS